MKRKDLNTRFWEKVDRLSVDGCWRWTASKNPGGYGTITINGRTTKASRVSWMLEHGPIPSGLWVLHHCDNPVCVRPSHLFLGTCLDNHRDSIAKGRRSRHGGLALGENNGRSKITNRDVAAIRKARANGERVIVIAARFGTSRQNIYSITNANTWAHIPLANRGVTAVAGARQVRRQA